MKIKLFLIFLLKIIFFVTFNAYAEVLFSENFDNQADWTVTQTTTSDPQYYPGNTSGTPPPSGWTGYRNGRSYCSGGPGYNNFYINKYAGYPEDTEPCNGGTGKCLTLWQESCNASFEDSDGILLIDLGEEYQELYVRFYLRFGYQVDNDFFQLGFISSDSPQTKIARVHHYLDGDPFQTHAYNQGNLPYCSVKLKTYASRFEINSSPRGWCAEENNNVNCYYFRGTPSYTWSCGEGCDYAKVDNSWRDSVGDGQWHCWEFYVKMNTYNSATSSWNADGVLRFYYDGVEVTGIRSEDIPWNQNGATETNPPRGWRHVAIGGNNNNRWTDNCSGTACEQWYAIDDVVIATEYIGNRPSPPQNLRIK